MEMSDKLDNNKKAEKLRKNRISLQGDPSKSWVEKVKPDPLNLLVKTSVGSKFCVNLPPALSGGFLFPLFHKKGIKYVKMFVSGRLGLLRWRRYTSDLKAFSANETFGMSVITSVVAENTTVCCLFSTYPLRRYKNR